MKIQLINENKDNLDIKSLVLANRNIPLNDMEHYLHTTDEDICSPDLFGQAIEDAAGIVECAYEARSRVDVVVDADCDGYTSAALFMNYCYCMDEEWTKNNIHYFLHEGKQHGLLDYDMSRIDKFGINIVVCPDSSSNDYEQHQALFNKGVTVLVMDHHEAPKLSKYATVVNNQLSDYPNKHLSGVGVTWQVCRKIDKERNTDYANQFLDLVALGNTADMMSMTSIETKHLIIKGFKESNLRNPFIYKMRKKNEYSIGEKLTPIGAAFYIAPFVNAMVRSGTQEEKDIVFRSMLTAYAFEEVPSTKRGHKLGEMETIADQAVRVATNVKARQTKAQDKGMDLVKNRIEANDMLDNKVLVFTLNSGEVDKNIAGLIANKIMASYQRPVCMLMRTKIDGVEYYQGSARGCDKVGVLNFKDICEDFPDVNYAIGHQGAFGLSLPSDKLDDFIEYTNKQLQDMESEAKYYVDKIYDGTELQMVQDIADIATLEDIWGKDVDEPLVAIMNLRITSDMVEIYEKKTNTLKITLPNGVNIMKFFATDEDCDLFKYENKGFITVNIVGKCNLNEWNGYYTSQVFCEEYEIINKSKYFL